MGASLCMDAGFEAGAFLTSGIPSDQEVEVAYQPNERWLIYDEAMGNLGSALKAIGYGSAQNDPEQAAASLEDAGDLLDKVSGIVEMHIAALQELPQGDVDDYGPVGAAMEAQLKIMQHVGGALEVFGTLSANHNHGTKVRVLSTVSEFFKMAAKCSRAAALTIREVGDTPARVQASVPVHLVTDPGTSTA